ncbi:hypothetical protein BH18VER1_BH18VER1_19200 [soil metagenome]
MKFTAFCPALLLLLCAVVCRAEAPRPNIIIFLVDDLGRADVGFTGGKEIRTPNIDRLAKEGAVLDSFYVQPLCSPTRAALLTGRYPTRTGVYNVVRPGAGWGLPLEERTLAQALKEAGYSTAICGKWHLGSSEPGYLPMSRGFDRQYGHFSGAIDYFTHRRAGQLDWYRNQEPLKERGYSTHLIAQEAQRVIREQPADKPLFLYVPFNGVHAPHQVPEKYTEGYEGLRGVRQRMAGMITAVDEAIGQIVAMLDDQRKQNTLIIFASDNGGMRNSNVASNVPLRAGKGTFYEGGVRVCAFATWPGKIPAGETIREPIHTVDWYPTLLNLAGVSLEQQLPIDGMDVWPTLTSGAKTPHDAILLVGGGPGKAGIRMGDWKLLLHPSERDEEEAPGNTGAKHPGGGGSGVELYNLANDIGERKNLAAAEPEKAKELRARLDAILAGAVKPGGGDAGGKRGVGPRKKRMRRGARR